MKQSYSQKETIEILKRALTVKDSEADDPDGQLTINDLEKMAAEFGISKTDLQKAATEITQTKEQSRQDLFPEVVTSKWIDGRLTDLQIESFFSDLKMEFGGSYEWAGKPSGIHKMGRTREYQLKDALVLLSDKGDGYQLSVIKQQFFHGNSLEAAIISIPAAFILGFLPVAAAAAWAHLYAAFFTGAVMYAATFFLVKRYTRKKRSETVAKLLRIADFAEMRLKELADPKLTSGSESLDGSQRNPNFTQSGNNRLST
jgi:hypothetical protein